MARSHTLGAGPATMARTRQTLAVPSAASARMLATLILTMSKPPKKLKGKPTTDERGNASWKWVGEDGPVKTDLVKALGEGLSLEPPQQKVSVDPYNQVTSPGKKKTKGRSLDDMRRLDEQMKREHERHVESIRKQASGKTAPQPALTLRLEVAGRELLLDQRRPSATVGRGEENDLVLTGERISRVHARLKVSGKKCALIDSSRNGTYVQTADGAQSFARGKEIELKGRGMIGLGNLPTQDSPLTIHFSCKEA
jgi:hypothetical protein